MRFCALVSTCLLVLPLSACSQGAFSAKSADSLAIAAASAQFIQDENRSDLNNFEVILEDRHDAFEVIFVPHQLEGREMWGGKTLYGREVHYYVEKNTYQIRRRHFAR